MARKFLHGCRGIYCREQADLSRLEMALESETPGDRGAGVNVTEVFCRR